MFDVYLGIGGNIGNRKGNIDKTINLITEKIGNPEKISSIYLSEPWGFNHSKYFTNSVVMVKTCKSPQNLLLIINEIESLLNRIRTQKTYEGRTMDVDILFYGNKIITNKELQIPHPKLHERLFVLMPLEEIASGFIHPILNKNIDILLKNCNDNSKIRRLYYES